MNKIKIEKRIHTGYTEFERAKAKGIKLRQMFGKFQYIYSVNNNEISLVYLKNFYFDNGNFWEIWCLNGGLLHDPERFNTKKEAEKRIRKLLK